MELSHRDIHQGQNIDVIIDVQLTLPKQPREDTITDTIQKTVLKCSFTQLLQLLDL